MYSTLTPILKSAENYGKEQKEMLLKHLNLFENIYETFGIRTISDLLRSNKLPREIYYSFKEFYDLLESLYNKAPEGSKNEMIQYIVGIFKNLFYVSSQIESVEEANFIFNFLLKISKEIDLSRDWSYSDTTINLSVWSYNFFRYKTELKTEFEKNIRKRAIESIKNKNDLFEYFDDNSIDSFIKMIKSSGTMEEINICRQTYPEKFSNEKSSIKDLLLNPQFDNEEKNSLLKKEFKHKDIHVYIETICKKTDLKFLDLLIEETIEKNNRIKDKDKKKMEIFQRVFFNAKGRIIGRFSRFSCKLDEISKTSYLEFMKKHAKTIFNNFSMLAKILDTRISDNCYDISNFLIEYFKIFELTNREKFKIINEYSVYFESDCKSNFINNFSRFFEDAGNYLLETSEELSEVRNELNFVTSLLSYNCYSYNIQYDIEKIRQIFLKYDFFEGLKQIAPEYNGSCKLLCYDNLYVKLFLSEDPYSSKLFNKYKNEVLLRNDRFSYSKNFYVETSYYSTVIRDLSNIAKGIYNKINIKNLSEEQKDLFFKWAFPWFESEEEKINFFQKFADIIAMDENNYLYNRLVESIKYSTESSNYHITSKMDVIKFFFIDCFIPISESFKKDEITEYLKNTYESLQMLALIS